jgi:hypothetical protein
MSNPNNCAACDHKRHPDGGWCYMFRNEPAEPCMQHTARARFLSIALRESFASLGGHVVDDQHEEAA